MNTDIRIAIGLSTHPKTIKLMRRCGDRSFYCLIRLWSWAAQYRPDGDLSGMDDEAIEIASDWQGDVGSFVTQLSSVGFIDGNSGCYQLHDWCHHNPWACKAEDRSDSGRLNKLAVKFPRQVEKLKENGVKGVTKSEYRSYIERWETESIISKPQGDPKPTPSQPLTPAPTPSPSPSPKEEKEKYIGTASKAKRFSPPTLQEVSAYCIERGNGVDPQRWVDHYTANGWRVGKNQMKDWRAAVRTWEDGPSSGGQKAKQSPQGRSQFETKDYGESGRL